MERKEVLLNLIFFLLTLPIIYTIFTLYAQKTISKTPINYANPLNLSIRNVLVSEDYLTLEVYNPNNFSVSIYIDIVGLGNGYGSAAIITSGGDIGLIKQILPDSYALFKFPILADPKNVIFQWERGNTTLKISLHYYEINKKIEGTVIIIT